MDAVNSLGHVEEMILLIIAGMGEEAYGVAIAEEYEKRLGKAISIPGVHTALRRLELKKLLKSSYGGVTAERGGRRKRFYQLSDAGYECLQELKATREVLYGLMNPRKL